MLSLGKILVTIEDITTKELLRDLESMIIELMLKWGTPKGSWSISTIQD